MCVFILGKSIAFAAEDGGGDAMEGEDEDVNVETEGGEEEPEAAVTETEKVLASCQSLIYIKYMY